MQNKTTKNIIHGIGGHAGDHWESWLNSELTKRGADCIMPQMPDADNPDRFAWIEAANHALAGVDTSHLIIVGHSLGVVTALDLAEATATPMRGIVSVSGFAYDYGLEFNGAFLRARTLDFSKVRQSVAFAAVFYGDDDPWVTQEALHQVAEGLDVEPTIIPHGGHLNTDAGYTTFPAVLEKVVGMIQ